MGLNLHNLVASSIGQVNSFIPATISQSTGYTTAADGRQIPAYSAPIPVSIQVQDLSSDDLKKIDGINIQGSMSAVYLSGAKWNGVVRVGMQGGDLLVFRNQTWLVVAVLENFPDWSKLAVVLQNGS
jgi:hypothetical protein